jgi:hypothetical protein
MKRLSEIQWSQKQDQQKNKTFTFQITNAWVKQWIKINTMLCKMSKNWKSASQKTFTVFISETQWFELYDEVIWEKNRDVMKEVLFFIFLSRRCREIARAFSM